MTQDRFLHILNYLNLMGSDEEIDKNGEIYDRMWKVIVI
jgi:hypothetical protein